MVASEQIDAAERKFVAADFEKCTGCGVCELVCALEREKLFDPRLSRIKVLRFHQLINLPLAYQRVPERL
jgi:Fe-S-cluster-containing dehydrogenase component